MSFFETTPLGRIMNRFAKGMFEKVSVTWIFWHKLEDIDTVDNLIGGERLSVEVLSWIISDENSDSLRMLTATASQIVGAIILISIIIPYFLIAAFFILIFYYYAALFYRASARELKVSHFDEVCRISTNAEVHSV